MLSAVRPRPRCRNTVQTPMHVVLLNQPFHPDVVATAQMGKDLADALIARGHRVSAIASRSIYGKAGATLPRRENIDGIEIHRVGASLFGRRGILARAADFGLFYILAASKLMTLPRADVVVGFTTPPMIGLLGLLHRAIRGGRAVYWVMDMYPDVPVACGVWRSGSPLVRVLERVHRRILKRSDAVVVLGRCMEERALSKGAPRDRVHMIPVWPVDEGIEPVPTERNALRREWGIGPDEPVVMYSGNFGIAHEAQTICRAMERLKEAPIRFEFIGAGARRNEVESFIARHGLTRARYRDYVPRTRLGESLSAGDIHLVSVREGLEGCIVPSKLYGVMAAARPIIYIGHPSSEVARMIEESRCGVLVREGDDSALAAAILDLARDPARRGALGASGLRALHGRFDAPAACGKWVRLLESLTGDVREPAPAEAHRNLVGAAKP
jgi:colanic acid biosynthesis glycosyl transferase WcaI